jgi:hypothetical protein
MTTTLYAMFDGEVLRPDQPLPFAPNTRVRLTVEPDLAEPRRPKSFLDTAERLKIDGPADWSANLDYYLYGGGDASKE